MNTSKVTTAEEGKKKTGNDAKTLINRTKNQDRKGI
jgi:hypothetical protein